MTRLLPLVSLVACGSPELSPGEVVSEGGLYVVAYHTEPEPPVVGPVVLALDLDGADGTPVPGASLQAEPWMVDMGHGITGEPEVTELGGGAYEIAFDLSMPGGWEVTVDIEADPGSDSVILPLDVQ